MALNDNRPGWVAFNTTTSNQTIAITPSIVWSEPLYVQMPSGVGSLNVPGVPKPLTEIERLRADVDAVCALGRAA